MQGKRGSEAEEEGGACLWVSQWNDSWGHNGEFSKENLLASAEGTRGMAAARGKRRYFSSGVQEKKKIERGGRAEAGGGGGRKKVMRDE